MTKKRSLVNLFLISAAIVFLLAQLIVQIQLARHDSETTDEGSHLNAGYSYVITGDFRFNSEHPPLTKELAGLAILHLNPKTTTEMNKLFQRSGNFFYDPWHENLSSSDILLYKAGNNPQTLLFWGRVPFVFITLILGLAIFFIALKEWGVGPAFLATALYTLDPTVSAHGHLINTDIPVALGYLLMIYASWQFFRRPNWWRALWLGFVFGLALLTKYTVVIAFPAFLILYCLSWWRAGKRRYGLIALPKLLLAMVIMILTIWAGYGFHDRVAPPSPAFGAEMQYADNHGGTTIGFRPPSVISIKDKVYTDLRPVIDLFPGDFVKGLYMVIEHGGSGQKEFLFGKISTHGVWYYFPLISLIKTPIPTIIFGLLATYWLVKRRPINWPIIYLLIGGAVFLFVAMFSKADLGIRYILPVLPLAILVIAAGFWPWLETGNLAIITTSILLSWLLVIYLFSYPSYMGYFNNFIGGSNQGYLVRSDSDVDWGQDIGRIASYLDTHHINKAYIDYDWDGASALNYYLGLNRWQPLSDWKPGQSGYAGFSGSAYEINKNDHFLKNPSLCTDLQHITPSVLICQLH